MNYLKRTLFLITLFIVHTSLLGKKNLIEGRVVALQDGDSFTLLKEDNTQEKIRLLDIDAPELGQPYGQVSKKVLSNLVYMKNVKVYWEKRDRNNRILGDVRVGNNRINEEMVALGYAWQYTTYNNGEHLRSLQNKARRNRLGLWQDNNPIAPWEWRKIHKPAKK